MSVKEDHDTRDKELFDYFIDDIVRLCFPELVEHLNFSQKVNISKDFTLPIHSSTDRNPEERFVDLLIEIPFVTQDPELAYDLLIDHHSNDRSFNLEEILKNVKIMNPNEQKVGKQKIHTSFLEPKARFLIHLESERTATRFEMSKRMWEYYQLISLKYPDCAILPIVIYFNQNISGIEWSSFKRLLLRKQIIDFCFVRIGLRGEKAEDWLNQDVPIMFALSIFMQYDKEKKALFKHQLLTKISESTVFSIEQKLVLNAYVEKALKLNPTDKVLFETLYKKEDDMPRVLTIIDEIDELKRIGRQEGGYHALIDALFSYLNIRKMPYSQEDEVLIKSVQDLDRLKHLLQITYQISKIDELYPYLKS